MSKKNNIEQLRHILNTVAVLMGEYNYQKSISLLEDIKLSIIDSNMRIIEYKEEIINLSDEIHNLELELKRELKKYTCDYSIDTQMGNKENIWWRSHNLACKTMMEEIGEAM